MLRTDISLSELQPDTNVHMVICADVNAHDIVWDKITNPNAWGECLVIATMDANSTFLNGPEQPTRQDPAMGAYSSPDVTIVHAAVYATLLQSGARCCQKTCRTEGSGDDRRVPEDE